MKKIYLLLLLLAGTMQAQIVNIPNPVFKAKLLASSTSNTIAKDINGNNMKIDANSDGNVQVSEAGAVYELDVSFASLANIEGLESFINVRRLLLYYNNLTGPLDVSMLTHLKIFYCDENDISSLNVSGLTEMTDLWCSGNLLTTLDVTSLSALAVLRVHQNNLTTVDLSGCPLLYQINLNENNILSIDFSNNPELYYIHLDYNPNLLSIDVSGLTHLWELDAEGGALTAIDASGCTALYNLRVQDNHIATLDITGCISLNGIAISNNSLSVIDASNLTSLASLVANYNHLTSVNLTGCSSLISLRLDNNLLTSIDVSDSPVLVDILARNNPLEYVSIKNGSIESAIGFFMGVNDDQLLINPDIDFICADEGQIASIQTMLNSFGMTNTVVNSYCSFTPGGNHNTITGKLRFDADADGCDTDDPVFPFTKMKISSGTTQGATFSLPDGSYKFYTMAGNFTVTPDIENPTFFNTTPTNAVVNFPNSNNLESIKNFCISANGIHPDLEIVVAPVMIARPGFNAVYEIIYRNKGNQAMSLSNGILLQYNNDLLDYVSSSETVSMQGTNSLNWDYQNLLPFESKSITVTFNVNAPTDTPAVNIGDQLQFTAGISPNNNDENTADNTFVYTETVIGSFDPNDITCLEGDSVSPDEIGEYLHYMINFENTGTAPAENIVVKLQIDPAKFDVSSLRIMNASHLLDTRVQTNKVEFIFQDIGLEGGAHGNVLLKIRSNNNLVAGNTVSQKADIYFDYNFPIATNIATTIFSTLSTGDTIKDNSVSIYPNPASDTIYINSSGEINSIELFDAQGRLLLVKTVSDIKADIAMSTYAAGIYYVRINTEKGIKTEKVIKN